MRRPTSTIREVQFHNTRLARIGAETITLAELRARAGAELLAPQRVDFHCLLMVQSGQGKHMIDFVEHRLEPGTLLLIKAGQVQQWHMHAGLQGRLLLVAGPALAPAGSRSGIDPALLRLDEWPATSVLGRTLWQRMLVDTARLRADLAAFQGDDTEAALIRHSLAALLLRLTIALTVSHIGATRSRETDIYRLFARELEHGLHERFTVLDYARRLGYSESTLSRACVAAVGHTAKRAIDLRLVLEAKRLLVHSQATVVQISHQLGFSEPTNFVKFFRRLAGQTPQQFRAGGTSAAG